MRSLYIYVLIIGWGVLGASCAQAPRSPAPAADSPQASVLEKNEKKASQVTVEKIEPSCDQRDDVQKFSFFINKKLELIVCAKVHQKLSDTVFDVSEVKVYSRNPAQKKTDLITETVSTERRELLLNFDHRKVLLFEDIQADKKLPLFSQEISCVADECFTKSKVCLFKRDPDIYAEGMETIDDVKKLLLSPDGQVKVLLAALSGFEPAVQAFSEREPQSLDKEAHDSFVLRKRQFEQALFLCKAPPL